MDRQCHVKNSEPSGTGKTGEPPKRPRPRPPAMPPVPDVPASSRKRARSHSPMPVAKHRPPPRPKLIPSDQPPLASLASSKKDEVARAARLIMNLNKNNSPKTLESPDPQKKAERDGRQAWQASADRYDTASVPWKQDNSDGWHGWHGRQAWQASAGTSSVPWKQDNSDGWHGRQAWQASAGTSSVQSWQSKEADDADAKDFDSCSCAV